MVFRHVGDEVQYMEGRGKEEQAASIAFLLLHTDEWHLKALEKLGQEERNSLIFE